MLIASSILPLRNYPSLPLENCFVKRQAKTMNQPPSPPPLPAPVDRATEAMAVAHVPRHDLAAPPSVQSPLQRMLRQAAHLATGNATAVGIGMMTLALMAQMLGPALLGIIAMVEAYGRLIDQIIRLESWQAIIRYGSAAIEKGDRAAFVRLVQFGVALDAIGALTAGAITFLAVPFVGAWLGWNLETQNMARYYSIAVVFGISSTPIGILRLFNRFSVIAWLEPVLALLRLAGVVSVAVLGGAIWPLLAIIIAIPCLQRLALTLAAILELRRNGYRFAPSFSGLSHAREFPDIWSLVLSSNGVVLIRKATQEMDILAVGAIAGPIGAGIYQFVRKFTLAAMKAGSMLQQVALPDLARLWARRDIDNFVTAIRHVELLTLAVAVSFVLGVLAVGDRAILLIAGPGFEDAGPALLVQSFAALLFLAGSALRPALMTMGLQPQVFRVALVAGVVFALTLYLATPRLGVIGAGVAHILFNIIWLPSCLLLFARALKREREPASPHHSPAPD